MSESDLDIVGIRDLEEDDRPFVFDAWLSSFSNSHFAGPISARRYREIYSIEIADLIGRPRVITRLAYNRHSRSQLFGFICFELGRRMPVLHFAYVKKPFRMRGVFALLAQDAGINLRKRFAYTYRTRLASDLTMAGARFYRAKFDPYNARYEHDQRERNEAAEDQKPRPERADSDSWLPGDVRVPLRGRAG